jgi:hypothetical protein
MKSCGLLEAKCPTRSKGRWCGLPKLVRCVRRHSSGAAVQVARNFTLTAFIMPTCEEEAEVPAIELSSIRTAHPAQSQELAMFAKAVPSSSV